MNKYIDHTNLKPMATMADIIKLCDEAKKFNFRGVCVNPYWLSTVAKELCDTSIKIVTVVGFPFGANHRETKVYEAERAIRDGADEIDMVWNLGLFKDKKYLQVVEEIAEIVEIGYQAGVRVKVIVETCYLTTSEYNKAYQIVKDSGAFCIKTSTGFGSSGAELLIIKTWKRLGDLKIKASGGIKAYHQAEAFIRVGADILGTSCGISIMGGKW